MSYSLEVFGTKVTVDTADEAVALARKVAEIQDLKCTTASAMFPATSTPMFTDSWSPQASFHSPNKSHHLYFPAKKCSEFTLAKHYRFHPTGLKEVPLVRTETNVTTPLLRKTLGVLKLISAAGEDGVETTSLMDLLETESPRGVGAKFRPIRTVLQGMGYDDTDAVFHVNREGGDEASWHAGPAIKSVIGQLEEWERAMS